MKIPRTAHKQRMIERRARQNARTPSPLPFALDAPKPQGSSSSRREARACRYREDERRRQREWRRQHGLGTNSREWPAHLTLN